LRLDQHVPQVVKILDLQPLAQHLHVSAAAQFGFGITVGGTVVMSHVGPRQIDEPQGGAGLLGPSQGRPFG
jgi:hypothetical protein